MKKTINFEQISPLMETNLTMIVCRADSPLAKSNILSKFSKLVERYNLHLIEVIDRKEEVIQVFKNLQGKYESTMLEQIIPQKRKTPAL